ncbi:hypothetical protein D3C87_1439570 [compost metagenome]
MLVHRPVAMPWRNTWPDHWRNVWAVSCAPRASTRRRTCSSIGAVMLDRGRLPSQGKASFSMMESQRSAYRGLHAELLVLWYSRATASKLASVSTLRSSFSSCRRCAGSMPCC